MTFYAGDEFADDDITSGLYDEDEAAEMERYDQMLDAVDIETKEDLL